MTVGPKEYSSQAMSHLSSGPSQSPKLELWLVIQNMHMRCKRARLSKQVIGLCTILSDRYGHTINSQVMGTGSPVHCPSSHVSKVPTAMGWVWVWP